MAKSVDKVGMSDMIDSRRTAKERSHGTAAYLARTATELSELAVREGWPVVAFYLNLARIEAETKMRPPP